MENVVNSNLKIKKVKNITIAIVSVVGLIILGILGFALFLVFGYGYYQTFIVVGITLVLTLIWSIIVTSLKDKYEKNGQLDKINKIKFINKIVLICLAAALLIGSIITIIQVNGYHFYI